MTKHNPTLPARMPEPSIYAGCSSIDPRHGVSAGASVDALTPGKLTVNASSTHSLAARATSGDGGSVSGAGSPVDPPRGGEIGRRGPAENCPPNIRPPSNFGLTPTVSIPLRTGRGQNDREHWRARASRVRAEKWAAGWALLGAYGPRSPWPLPLRVTLTRGAPSSGLDDDNLAGSLKAVRDAVAEWLEVDDARRDLVRYAYAQERSNRTWFVRITFEAMP